MMQLYRGLCDISHTLMLQHAQVYAIYLTLYSCSAPHRYKIVRILARNDAALPRIMRYNAHFNAAAYIVLCNISHTLLFQPAKDYAIYRILSCYRLHRVMRYIAHFYVATYKGLCDISHTFMLRATQGYAIYCTLFATQVSDRSTNLFSIGPRTSFRWVSYR